MHLEIELCYHASYNISYQSILVPDHDPGNPDHDPGNPDHIQFLILLLPPHLVVVLHPLDRGCTVDIGRPFIWCDNLSIFFVSWWLPRSLEYLEDPNSLEYRSILVIGFGESSIFGSTATDRSGWSSDQISPTNWRVCIVVVVVVVVVVIVVQVILLCVA